MNRSTPHPPPALRRGDRLSIVAPASCFPRDAFMEGVEWLTARGFDVQYNDELFEREYYLAGSRERRAGELNAALGDATSKAVLAARGGFGLMHVLPHVDWQRIVAHPQILMGYSDLTPLLNYVTDTLGLITFHGPLVASIHKTRPASLERLVELLTETVAPPAPIGGPEVTPLRGGRAEGRLCGGNLSMIAATLGTPFELDTRGKILVLEDVGERPYRIDRLLTQLSLAGKFDDAAAVAIGTMIGCEEPDGRGRPLREIFEQVFADHRLPVVTGLPFGHGAANDPLPLGAPALLDADRGTLHVTIPVVA